MIFVRVGEGGIVEEIFFLIIGIMNVFIVRY